MSDEPVEAVDVLLVDENTDDVRHIRDAFAELDLEISIDVATDGAEALALLTDAADDEAPMPDLILLDLSTPRMGGLELLERITAEPRLARLPILVLTRSASVDEIAESYELGANASLTKPDDEARYAELVTAIADFWFRRVVLPTDS